MGRTTSFTVPGPGSGHEGEPFGPSRVGSMRAAVSSTKTCPKVERTVERTIVKAPNRRVSSVVLTSPPAGRQPPFSSPLA